ncbi:MAG: c-type cytochrome [Chloroflexi bacterium]|nr:c-type cytochrome [Chloroflexota bacterium]
MGRGPRRFVVAGAALVALAIAAAVVGGPLALTHRSELPLERRYGEAMVTLTARLGAGSQTNPLAGDARSLQRGRDAYTGGCASCHGVLGDGRGVLGATNYPPASDLRADTVRGKSDAELFWIVRNGLSFTAMPAFKDLFRDEDIWAMVVYMRRLQDGTAKPVSVAPATAAQIAFADPHGSPAQRGAAVWFAQGCDRCHGGAGAGPEGMNVVGKPDTEAVRTGLDGMPRYGTDRVTDAELEDLLAFMLTFK